MRYVWPQNLHVILIDLIDVLPSLILELIPGAMKLLHFLQKSILRTYGILTLCRILNFRASEACLCANFGFIFALEIALSIKISILSNTIFLTMGFMQDYNKTPKNFDRLINLDAVTGI